MIMFQTVTLASNHMIKGLIFSFMMLLWCRGVVFAQPSTNVSITGVQGTLPRPYFSDFEQNVYNGVYQVQADMGGNSTINVRFQITISKDGQELVDETSLPIELEPGINALSLLPDYLEFSKTTNQVLSGLPSNITEQIIQGGVLPEGDYTITMQAYEAGFNISAGSGGTATFMV